MGSADIAELRKRVGRTERRSFRDFVPGRVFEHQWARTVTEADNVLFTTLTLSYNPLYFDDVYARAQGHPSVVLNPMLILLTTFGLSVEDLSEAGGPLLGIDSVRYLRPCYPGDTLRARSVVVDTRESGSRPGMGIVRWQTTGSSQRGADVVEFERSNLIPLEPGGHAFL